MTVFSAIIVFVLSWWLVFFAVLPIGIKGQWEDGTVVPGTDEGAPQRTNLPKKALWAAVGAAVLTGIASVLIPRLLAQ